MLDLRGVLVGAFQITKQNEKFISIFSAGQDGNSFAK
jgi:hypothetical protein